MDKRMVISLSFLFLLSFTVASSSETDVNIGGCNLPSGGGLLSNTCSQDRNYFCLENLTLLDSLDSTCTIDSNCCPSGYQCSDDKKCEPMEVVCSDFKKESNCKETHDNGVCFWINTGVEETSFCTSNPAEGNCGVYSEDDACEEDAYNFGNKGEGADVCGTISDLGYTISDCGCSWEEGEEECLFSYSAGETFFSGDRNSFDCIKKFSVEECINGEQEISWKATSSNLQTQTILDSSKCSDDSRTRICGAAAIKLPGFSTYAAILVLLIIVTYYIYNTKKPKK
jgi:hypothetical protein